MAKKTTTPLTPVGNYPTIVKSTFKNMVDAYKRMFNGNPLFCLAIANRKKHLVFPERNLTFNFCNEYLKLAGKSNGDEIIVWQELDIIAGTGRGLVDTVILDLRKNVNAVLFIEAKRIAAGGDRNVHKCEGLSADMKRLSNIITHNNSDGLWNLPEELYDIIQTYNPTLYKMALVDYWKWKGQRVNKESRCKDNFEQCSGNQFVQINGTPIHSGTYYLNYCLTPLNPSKSCGLNTL